MSINPYLTSSSIAIAPPGTLTAKLIGEVITRNESNASSEMEGRRDRTSGIDAEQKLMLGFLVSTQPTAVLSRHQFARLDSIVDLAVNTMKLSQSK